MQPIFPLKFTTQGQGAPILCLHGHPGSGQSLAVFTEHLGQQFSTIAPDLRGYGQSQYRQAFTMTDHLDDLIALLDRLGIDRCLILGWSLGGILALELADRYPDRVTGLILIATAAQPRSDHPPIHWQDYGYTGIAALLNLLRPGWGWNIRQFGWRSLFRYLIQQHHPHTYRYIAKYAAPAYLKTSKQATQALMAALGQGYSGVTDLEQIRCPCLMLIGEHDRHITAASSLATAKALPNCDWQIYENTAHLLPWEIPEQILTDLDRWLASHPEVVAFP